MKAVIVIDVPDNILLGFSKANIEIKESAYLVSKDESKWKYTKPIKIEDVPLRPLPQMKSIELACQKEDEGNDYGAGLIVGWNDCLREIQE